MDDDAVSIDTRCRFILFATVASVEVGLSATLIPSATVVVDNVVIVAVDIVDGSRVDITVLPGNEARMELMRRVYKMRTRNTFIAVPYINGWGVLFVTVALLLPTVALIMERTMDLVRELDRRTFAVR